MSLSFYLTPVLLASLAAVLYHRSPIFQSKSPTAARMLTLTMFGDSITQGAWQLGGTGGALAHVYQRKLDVLNRGFSGYNTVWGLTVAKDWMPRKKEDLAKIALMTICAALPPSPQSITIAEFKANLHTIINLLRSPDSLYYSPTTKFILITPPPVDADVRNNELASRVPARVPDRDTERTRQFAVAVLEVGQETGITVVDCWTAITNAAANAPEGLARYLSDGLHLTADGYQVVTEGVANAIATRLPELHWDAMGEVFPNWQAFIPPEHAHDSLMVKPAAKEQAVLSNGAKREL